MLKMLTTIACAVLLSSFASGPAWAQDCEEARCAFQQQLLADCNCDTADNHGQYVSCAAHLIKDLIKDGSVPQSCHGKLQRCAARSVCGKQARGFHTCTRMEFGTCVTTDTVTGTGACEHDPSISCTTNEQCVVSSRCKITRHPETCEDSAGGEFLDLAPTCCSNCAAPPAP